jgi:hypothetical protein
LRRGKISFFEFNCSVLCLSMIFIYFNFIFPSLWKDNYYVRHVSLYVIFFWIFETLIVHFFSPLIFIYLLFSVKRLNKINYEDFLNKFIFKNKIFFYPIFYFFLLLFMKNYVSFLNFDGKNVNAVIYKFMDTDNYFLIFSLVFLFFLIVILFMFLFVVINNLLFYEVTYKKT